MLTITFLSANLVFIHEKAKLLMNIVMYEVLRHEEYLFLHQPTPLHVFAPSRS